MQQKKRFDYPEAMSTEEYLAKRKRIKEKEQGKSRKKRTARKQDVDAGRIIWIKNIANGPAAVRLCLFSVLPGIVVLLIGGGSRNAVYKPIAI